ncbi:triphosphate pyrophosphohydrolase [Moumouvirus australiensis]|uniref:Triphosphate pyrophosphohydrolase n=1 Tax=Moumouvirus australiensis TaxID=2109587 RepID=A0A2P1ELE3_9VIRU|nr:triphosphate pyrophosphohydrolase [Moumouvirus australiensis]AVL94721.1 triphosphate pyrophosphohydrolase [Moumouvirus australiensis]
MSNKTNFKLVGEFNAVFGHPVNTQVQKNIFDEKPNEVNLRFNLIKEEFHELEDGIKNKNMTEVVDALGDLLYVVYGMGQVFGLDLDEAFRRVHNSNMSKLCKNEKEAMETVEHYKTLSGFEDVEVSYRPSEVVPGHYVMFNVKTGKILKSKYFELPNFSDLVN